ncbi:MAG: addiction module protein [Crocinitomicaceae bacterium]
MNISVKEITEQAFALPANEREKIASSLFQSTHNSELTDIDREWISVAEERFTELQSGKDIGIPESEFFAKVRKKVQWK